MYSILIPISRFSIRDQKIISIIRKESNILKQQKKKFSNDDTQYNYYIRREYNNRNVGTTTRPIDCIKKRLLPEMRYKGFNIKDVNINGKTLIRFD